MSTVLISNFRSCSTLTYFLRSIAGKNQVLHRSSCSFRSILKMNEAFLWHKKGNETFDFTFRYIQPALNVDRQFNLSRKVDENVATFLNRLDVNMRKVLDKKKKKKSKKAEKKSEAAETTEAEQSNVEEGKIMLLRGGTGVDLSGPCSDIIADPRDLSLVIFDQKYVVKFNAPWVKELELPNCILADFPLYASTFVAKYTDKSKSLFTWYKCSHSAGNDSKNRGESWEKVGEGFLYVPKSEDIGHRIKLACLPSNEVLQGPEVEIEGKARVEAGPGECPFQTRQQFTNRKLAGNEFRIVSYNLLADTYADSDYSREVLFPYCPPYALAMDYRKLLIVKELIGYNADVLCLQEVDKKVYEYDLAPALSSLNYQGVFSTKGETLEGLAVFYDDSRFQLLDSKCTVMGKGIELNDVFGKMWTNVENENARQRFSDRNTSLMIVTLQSRDNPSEILVVGNTHLYFHPDADHIRLLQGYYALTDCQHTVEVTKRMYPGQNVTLILSGDFNSSPADGIYQLMTQKHVAADHVNWKSNPEQIIENISLSHEMSLASACGTPQYTNFTVEFADCLDYIFYENKKLEVTQIVPMPSKEELSLHGAIPSVVFPSDHIAICADLKWT